MYSLVWHFSNESNVYYLKGFDSMSLLSIFVQWDEHINKSGNSYAPSPHNKINTPQKKIPNAGYTMCFDMLSPDVLGNILHILMVMNLLYGRGR
jgi:hypothetical protein